MNIEKAIEELFKLDIKKLPRGEDGDGISYEHAKGALNRLKEEHLPNFKKAEQELFYTKLEGESKVKKLFNNHNLLGSDELPTLIDEYKSAVEDEKSKDIAYTKAHTKLHRWLGWFQGVFVSFGLTTLDEMKEINKNS